MREQLLALDELARTDLAQRQVDVELNEIEDGLASLRDAVSHIKSLLERERTALHSAETLRASHVVELEGIAEKAKRNTQLRENARNNREMEATQRALEELKRQREERTAEAERLQAVIVDTRAQIERHAQEFDELVAELAAAESAGAARSAFLRAQKLENQGARTEVAKKVRADLFRIYTMVFNRRGSGVAELEGGICRACNMVIPPQLHNQVLAAEKIFQCPSCQRFLLPSFIVQPAAAEPR